MAQEITIWFMNGSHIVIPPCTTIKDVKCYAGMHLNGFYLHIKLVQTGGPPILFTDDNQQPPPLSVFTAVLVEPLLVTFTDEEWRKVLLQHGQFVDIQGLSKSLNYQIPGQVLYDVFEFCIDDENSEMVHSLCNANADVNCTNNIRWTPLHRAARHGYSEMVQVLVNSNGNVNGQNDYGNTPLHWASLHGHSEMVTLLVNLNAQVNRLNNAGYSPLHWAAIRRHSETVHSLCNANCQVNIQDKLGENPLHRAISYGHSEMVQLLVNLNAHV